MENNSFRSSLFGGFSRKDVVEYIEKSSAAANERIEVLEERCTQLSHENAGLQSELESVTEDRDRLDGEMHEAMDRGVQLKDALNTANAQLAALQAKCDALTAERAQLQAEIAQLRPKAEQFAAVKANIAELELAARRRANSYEAETRERADQYDRETRLRADTYASETSVQVGAMLDSCRAQCDLILATLDETCANVTAELQKSSTSITRLPAAFHTLRHDLAGLGSQDRENKEE